MNIEKHLILVKEEDKTEQIKYCKRTAGKWEVSYYNSDSTYSYNYSNVKWFSEPKEINAATVIVYHNNQPVSGIAKILDFSEYVRIFFKTGYKKTYRRSNITIEETCLTMESADNCFQYLKKLADHVGTKLDEEKSFLSKQY